MADTYKNLKQAVAERQQRTWAESLYDNEHENALGQVILTSSFQGSPHWNNSKFLDDMAIVQHLCKPDLFITMTCYPQWPEITADEFRK